MLNLMKTFSCFVVCLALLSTLPSCAPARTRSLRKAFVPPSDSLPARTVIAPPPPSIQARTDAGEPLRLPSSALALTAPSRAEAVAAEADSHFQEGRRLFAAGDEAGARREFDQAVDLLLATLETTGTRGIVDRKLDQLVDAIHRLDLTGLGAGDADYEPPTEKPPLEDIPQLTFPVDPKLKDKVAEELRATSSQLPLEVNEAVLSYISFFTGRAGHKTLVAGLRRSGRYRSLIQRILDEEGVPQELIFLAQAESGFYPRAVSRTRNVGMWQFGLDRGRQYGLLKTPFRDDRSDPERSTRAAARHLRDLYHRYGDWYLAMAAYNCGPGVIDKAVERTGYADFWELRRRHTMPLESTNYVPAILAMTIMVKNPKEYGLEDLDPEPPLEYDTVEIAAPASLSLIGDLTDCPVPQLRDLNPSLSTNIAPPEFSLHVPKGSAATLAAALDSIPAARRVAWRAHRVSSGDTLATIARRYRVSEARCRLTAAVGPGQAG